MAEDDDFHVMGTGAAGVPIEHVAQGMAKAERPSACYRCGGNGTSAYCTKIAGDHTDSQSCLMLKLAGRPKPHDQTPAD
jgi:hypothetical protein